MTKLQEEIDHIIKKTNYQHLKRSSLGKTSDLYTGLLKSISMQSKNDELLIKIEEIGDYNQEVKASLLSAFG